MQLHDVQRWTDNTASGNPALQELLNPGTEITKLIPDYIDADSYWEYLSVACGAYVRMNSVTLRLRPAIGRMLLLAMNNPTYYTGRGYGNYEDFLVRGVCKDLGLSRTVAYQTKRIVEQNPGLTADDWQKIGPPKLGLLSRYVSEGNSSYSEHLDVARHSTYKELVGYCEKMFGAAKGESDVVMIVIAATGEIASMWNDIINNERVHSALQSTDPKVIFLHMLQEAAGEWGV